MVKSAEPYAVARLYKYSPPQSPEPARQSHALAESDRVIASLITTGRKPAIIIMVSILMKNAISDLCCRANRFHPACVQAEISISPIASGDIFVR